MGLDANDALNDRARMRLVRNDANGGQHPDLEGLDGEESEFIDDRIFKPHDIEDLNKGDIKPRQWLLSHVLCRQFVTVLAAKGGSGKTTLILAWVLSLATGRPLVGDHVHKRARSLILTFEDDIEEYRRRLRAARMHHGIGKNDRGYCFIIPLANLGIALASTGKHGNMLETTARRRITKVIRENNIDVVVFDPFIKLSDGDENSNRAQDFVANILIRIAHETNTARF